MKNLRLYIIILLFFIVHNVAAFGSSGHVDKSVRLRTFSMIDGLPSNSIQMMTAGQNGLLWIATWNGLCNYDGYRFNTFMAERGKEQVLHGYRLVYAMPSDNGDVWVTTFDDKLFLLDANERRYVNCDEKLEALGLKDFRVQYMQSLEDGGLWIQGKDGVNLKVKDGKLEKVNKAYKKTGYETLRDSKGRVWSIKNDGTVFCQIKTNAGLQTKTFNCSFPDTWPKIFTEKQLIIEDLSGTIWMLPNGKTICYLDERTGRLVPINLREVDQTLPDDIKVTRPFIDKNKNLWFRSSFNLCRMSFCDNNFHYYPIADKADVRSMLIDTKGRLWVGTKQGYVALVDSDSHACKFLSSVGRLAKNQVAFNDKGVYAIHEDRWHHMWLGTRGNGLYRLTPRGETFDIEHFMNMPDEENAGYSHIYDIQEDAFGRVWFATYGKGIMYFDENQNRFFTAENTSSIQLPEGNIRKVRRIETADDGTLVFSTTEGIITLNPNFKRPEDIRLYISQYTPNRINSLLAPDVLQTLVCKHSRQTLVATMGGGIQNIQSGSLLHNPLEFGTVENDFTNIGNIRGMVEDTQGSIWLIGENAIHWLAADGKKQLTYTTNDWGRNIQFSEAKPIIDPKTNNVIVGTLSGILSFDPMIFRAAKYIPSIVFTSIQYQGDETPTSLLGNGEIILPTDRHNAVVYFAALDYEDNLQIRYAYRIRELDERWSFVGMEHCASLSNLPPGHYTLEVRSTNNEGVWIDNNAELKIYVEPTFWQTSWAWLLYFIIGGIMLYLIYYLIWLRKTNRMEKMMKESQLRFFTDISHQLRTPLTLIGGPVTEVLNSEQLSEKAHNLLKAVENNASKMLALVDKSLTPLAPSQIATGAQYDSSNENSQQDISNALSMSRINGEGHLTILIVEDNDELRYFLKTSLATYYNIIEAENGKVGLLLAAEHQPDFIITDVMMPEMDGITMIRRIKSDETICHIPIIILSARTADVYRIEGLKEGADDYITKPFSMSYLQVRVESIVHQRRMLQAEWRKSLTTPSAQQISQKSKEETIVLPEVDQKFAENLTVYINDNLNKPDLKIDDVASAMCMSRTVLYGKIKAIYGVSPNDVLRNLRISHACTILREDSTKSVAEVAQSVGYTDAKYFARYFKQIVGVTPSEYRKG